MVAFGDSSPVLSCGWYVFARGGEEEDARPVLDEAAGTSFLPFVLETSGEAEGCIVGVVIAVVDATRTGGMTDQLPVAFVERLQGGDVDQCRYRLEAELVTLTHYPNTWQL